MYQLVFLPYGVGVSVFGGGGGENGAPGMGSRVKTAMVLLLMGVVVVVFLVVMVVIMMLLAHGV